MDDRSDDLLVLAASRLKGAFRRTFQAEVCLKVCDGSPRKTEERFGWARDTVAKGLTERELDPSQLAQVKSNNRGRQRSEEANPQLAIDIRLIVEPHTQSDPELKTERSYTNLSAREVRKALLDRGYLHEELPSERTLRDILNRMNYRLKRIQKGKPLKKTEHTDAIFENVEAAKRGSEDAAETLEISIDTKTKVKLGEFSLGGEKRRTTSDGQVPQALDHDPPAKEKLVPFGVLIVGTGLLTLVFGKKECSDFWGDCLRTWWTSVRSRHRGIRRLVIYLDNGPKNSGVTRKFLRRIVDFSDWSGLEVRLVYYPPYHSRYNPIERCWSSLQQKWNGTLLTCWQVVKSCAGRMTWQGAPPEIHRLAKGYATEQAVGRTEMDNINARLTRSETLPKYDIVIKPLHQRGR